MITDMLDKVIELYFEPFKSIALLIKRNKTARIVLVLFLLLFIFSTLSLLVYSNYLSYKDPSQAKFIISNILPIFIIPLGVLFLIFYFAVIKFTPIKIETEIEKLNLERAEIIHKIEGKKELEIFDTIQLSLNQLNEYYTINKAQAKSSFRFSIFIIVFGLATIVIGIWIFYLNAIPNINLTALTGISGILLEFIGGAYFFMYKRSLEQVNFFFAQLIKIQDTMLSINLAKNIGSKEKETEMTEKIITSLLERSLQ